MLGPRHGEALYSEIWRGFSDEQVAQLMTGVDQQTVRLSELAEELLQQAALTASDIHRFTKPLALILVTSLVIEFDRRVREAESKRSRAGRPLRELVMMKSGPGLSMKEARDLARLGQRKKRWNPDGFGSAREAEDETTQMYWLALQEGLSTFPPPSILSLEGLHELLSGYFGRIAAAADNTLGGRLRTLKRRQEMTDLGAKE